MYDDNDGCLVLFFLGVFFVFFLAAVASIGVL